MTKKISSSWISHRQSAVIQWGKQQGKSFPHLLQWKNEIYIKQKLYLSVGGRGGGDVLGGRAWKKHFS